jgi:hypothetical protein
MENKYFTPDIEDLCIGYECELLMNTDVSILNPTSNAPEFKPFIFEKNKIELLIELYDSIRVPYLTKEQIEAEGWVYVSMDMCWIKNGIELYFQKDNKIEILDQPNFLFQGECKDINTFRKIIKLLNI